MQEREPTMMKRLLDRLLSARARRDREERFSDSWLAADAELHAIERAIFRVPIEGDGQPPIHRNGDSGPGDPASFNDHRQARDQARADTAAAERHDIIARTDHDDRGSRDHFGAERAG